MSNATEALSPEARAVLARVMALPEPEPPARRPRRRTVTRTVARAAVIAVAATAINPVLPIWR